MFMPLAPDGAILSHGPLLGQFAANEANVNSPAYDFLRRAIGVDDGT